MKKLIVMVAFLLSTSITLTQEVSTAGADISAVESASSMFANMATTESTPVQGIAGIANDIGTTKSPYNSFFYDFLRGNGNIVKKATTESTAAQDTAQDVANAIG